MNILVTAIGSMSADCVIRTLKKSGDIVVGCDIYSNEWLLEAKLCDKFYQAPLALDKERYIRFLIQVCMENEITHLIPLTDIEIDVINESRVVFENKHITLCMPSQQVIAIVRNKYRLYNEFKNDVNVPSVKTFPVGSPDISTLSFPCIAKPFNGRSSEGLKYLSTSAELSCIKDKAKYIVQEYKSGSVFTVDYIRCEYTQQDFSVVREELLRTKNGAGLTVKIGDEVLLNKLVSYIGRKLQINGCVNMEFIKNDTVFYLIDINPRFSAGIAFTVLAGYDMITNHLNCFNDKKIDSPVSVKKNIVTKTYKEIII